MSTKTRALPTGGNTGANAASTETREYRTNPEVDSKIDAYIKENPKYWATFRRCHASGWSVHSF